MKPHASVVFDNGRIVQARRETITKKYSNLMFIRELHDFLVLRNSGKDVTRDSYSISTLKHTPMIYIKYTLGSSVEGLIHEL